MARDEGFAVADVATAKHTDPKFRKLWRELNDEQAMNAAVVLHEAITLLSWQHGKRVTADEAAPFWQTDTAASVAALQRAGLLDRAGRLPKHAWESWYLPAYERREQRREAGRIGGQRSRPPGSEGEAPPKRRLGTAVSNGEASLNPSVPSVPTVPSVPAAPSSPPVAREEHAGSKTLTREERIAAYDEKAANPALSDGVRQAAALEADRLRSLS